MSVRVAFTFCNRPPLSPKFRPVLLDFLTTLCAVNARVSKEDGGKNSLKNLVTCNRADPSRIPPARCSTWAATARPSFRDLISSGSELAVSFVLSRPSCASRFALVGPPSRVLATRVV